MVLLVHPGVRVKAIVLAALGAALLVPAGSTAAHCSKVLIFSEIAAGRGVNAGIAGCSVPGERDTNRLLPGATSVIVGYTGGRTQTPAGTISINGVESGLRNPVWDADRWTFAPVRLTPGTYTVTATVYPASDPRQSESVTYRSA